MISDKVLVVGKKCLNAQVIFPSFKQITLFEFVRSGLFGQFYQQMRMTRFGGFFFEFQDFFVIKIQMLLGQGIGFGAGIIKKLEERQKQRVMGFVPIPFCKSLLQRQFRIAHDTGIGSQELVKNGSE